MLASPAWGLKASKLLQRAHLSLLCTGIPGVELFAPPMDQPFMSLEMRGGSAAVAYAPQAFFDKMPQVRAAQPCTSAA